MARQPVRVAAASRPYPGEVANGDAWQVDWHEGACRIAVVDGLGHGPEAASISTAALGLLAERPDLSPAEGLRACHLALSKTRGAAMLIAWIKPAAGELVYAGVGNVEAHLWQDGRQQRLVAYRGIVGTATPTIRPFSLALGSEWLLLIHTDGIRARFEADKLPEELLTDPQRLADGILLGWGREMDDATVVVAAPAQ